MEEKILILRRECERMIQDCDRMKHILSGEQKSCLEGAGNAYKHILNILTKEILQTK